MRPLWGQCSGAAANVEVNTGSCAPGGFDFVTADGATQLLIQITNDTATVIAYNIEQSIDGGATWYPALTIGNIVA